MNAPHAESAAHFLHHTLRSFPHHAEMWTLRCASSRSTASTKTSYLPPHSWCATPLLCLASLAHAPDGCLDRSGQGEAAVRSHFERVLAAIPSDLLFVIDDITEDASGAAGVGLAWHVELDGRPFPFGRGASFYRVARTAPPAHSTSAFGAPIRSSPLQSAPLHMPTLAHIARYKPSCA